MKTHGRDIQLSIISILLLFIASLSFGSNNKIEIDESQNEKGLIPFKVTYNVTTEPVISSPLTISSDDILWEFDKNGEYVDMIIRKKRAVGSVMLTNMYYNGKYINEYGNLAYGLRARDYNTVNGKEVRIVNKKTLGPKQSLHFLVDSHPEKHALFGSAFRIRIPKIVEYGYKHAGDNYGIITIEKGVTLNLRAYQRKYADHRGKFQNNPIEIDFTAEDYQHRLKPTLTKIKEYDENGYRVVMIRYSSRINYVKYFLVRDIHTSDKYRRISFASNMTRTHNTAKVLRAIKKEGSGINITALLFFKITGAEKDYEISAVDHENRTAKNFIPVVVSRSGKVRELIDKEKRNKPRERIIIEKEDDDSDFFR